jgi:hypothetical protein
LEQLEHREMLAIITVNVAFDEDDGVGDNEISLRDAILVASDDDLIDFDPEAANIATLDLTLGQIDVISKSITIDASMLPNGITIIADTDSRIFEIIDSTSGTSPPKVTMVGLTLSGGSVLGQGGAIRSAGLLDLQNCTIEGNEAVFSEAGGIYVSVAGNGSTPRPVLNLENTSVKDNMADLAGGVRVIFNSTSDDFVTIHNSTFEGNTASNGDGGGLYISASSTGHNSIEIANTTFTNNETTGKGGAILLYSISSQTDLLVSQGSKISGETTLEGNKAYAGGGIFALGEHGSQVRIENSEISNNGSDTNGGGVLALLTQSSSLVIESSIISGNTAEGENANGVMGNGGGVYARTYSHYGNPFPATRAITISQSRITGNTALNRGGGLFTYNADGTESLVHESTISGNSVPTSTTNPDRNGGGIYAYFLDQSGATQTPRFIITGSTVDHNEADMMGGGIFVCSKYYGEFVATNSTFSANETLNTSSGMGGGMLIAHFDAGGEIIEAYLRNLTVTDNTSSSGAGIATKRLGGMNVRISNSIVSANHDHSSVESNLFGPIMIDESFNNLVGNGSVVYDSDNHTGAAISLTTLESNNDWIIDDDPGLEDLGWYGGPTETHRLSIDSPAIDEGDDDYAVDPITDVPLDWDQRGEKFSRIMNVPGIGGNDGNVDIGAYEIGLAKVIDVRLDGVMVDALGTPAWTAGPISYAELVPLGLQFAPIYRDGVKSIQILFSEAVQTLDGSELTLRATGARGSSTTATIGHVAFNPTDNIWTFEDVLPGDKYRIDILTSDVLDAYGRTLDGYWDNSNGGTFEIFTDDPPKEFPSGTGMGGSHFQFMFALLPGDYDQNGVVNTADETLLATAAIFDGNGDGDEDSADHAVWSAHDGQQLQMRRMFGDFNDDELTSSADYVVWRATFGSTSDLTADANGNGTVDAGDYILWRFWENTLGAWFVGSSGVGALLPMVDFGNAPTVINVTISGWNSTHAAYSFDGHDGSGDQLTTVPVGGADTISITFSEDVNVAVDNLRMIGLRTANVPTLVEFSYDIPSMTATWRYDDLVANDHYVISLSDAVTDIEGNRLDGEWVNPVSWTTTNSAVSEFPSGDGDAGGHFNFVVTLLEGDANFDLRVNSTDFNIWLNSISSSSPTFAEADFNGDGFVDIMDYVAWANNSGLDLQTSSVLADLDGDFDVDDDDLAIFEGNLGMSTPTAADGDFDGDGDVDADDLDLMFAQYGLELVVVS